MDMLGSCFSNKGWGMRFMDIQLPGDIRKIQKTEKKYRTVVSFQEDVPPQGEPPDPKQIRSLFPESWLWDSQQVG